MNPREACEYMADRSNWSSDGLALMNGLTPMEFSTAALSHEAEIVPGMMLHVRREDRPCRAGCGEPFQPGQAYLADGPYHVGCAPRKRIGTR